MSLVLATDAKAYVAGLTAFRQDRPADWILLLAQAIERAAAKASELALRLAPAHVGFSIMEFRSPIYETQFIRPTRDKEIAVRRAGMVDF